MSWFKHAYIWTHCKPIIAYGLISIWYSIDFLQNFQGWCIPPKDLTSEPIFCFPTAAAVLAMSATPANISQRKLQAQQTLQWKKMKNCCGFGYFQIHIFSHCIVNSWVGDKFRKQPVHRNPSGTLCTHRSIPDPLNMSTYVWIFCCLREGSTEPVLTGQI